MGGGGGGGGGRTAVSRGRNRDAKVQCREDWTALGRKRKCRIDEYKSKTDTARLMSMGEVQERRWM